ncbi:hypothetical protein ACEPAF_5821 [Sanghuangporus sanghuang]
MSTVPANKYQFMVYAPDKTDEGTLQRRMSVRQQHLENAKKLGADGILKFGRGLLSPESISTPGAEQKLIGSLMIFEAPKLEDVKKLIESDLYYTNSVWDPERIVILPFLGLPLSGNFA